MKKTDLESQVAFLQQELLKRDATIEMLRTQLSAVRKELKEVRCRYTKILNEKALGRKAQKAKPQQYCGWSTGLRRGPRQRGTQ